MRQKVRIRQLLLGNRSVYPVMKGHMLVEQVRPFSFLPQIEDSLGGFGQRKGKGENGRCCILFLSSPLSLLTVSESAPITPLTSLRLALPLSSSTEV